MSNMNKFSKLMPLGMHMKWIPPSIDQQKHINYNNSQKGRADYLKACRDAAESLTDSELKDVISDVFEYGEIYRKVCSIELTGRNK